MQHSTVADQTRQQTRMSRRVELDQLYAILDELRCSIGDYRYLNNCTGKSGWPNRGLYFFFEDGEFREDGTTPRVVRAGTHAISRGSRTTLWNRLHTVMIPAAQPLSCRLSGEQRKSTRKVLGNENIILDSNINCAERQCGQKYRG